MKEKKNIRNLDTLDGEIYRLKLETKNIEQKLDKNLDYLQDNYWRMTMNSLFCKDDNNTKEDGFWKNVFKHDGVNETINTIAGNIADKASENLHGWMSKFFGKKKH